MEKERKRKRDWRGMSWAVPAMFMALAAFPARAGVIPRDLPTIEALIELHKLMAKEEDRTMARLAVMEGEQKPITKEARRFRQSRVEMNTKLSTTKSYLTFAALLASCAASTGMAVKEYADFAGTSFSRASDLKTRYFSSVTAEMAREVAYCTRLSMSLAASGVWKASMEEKMRVMLSMKDSIERMRRILASANAGCRNLDGQGWEALHIWDILTPATAEDIARRLKDEWRRNL